MIAGMAAGAASASAPTFAGAQASGPAGQKTFVFAHGSWHGGWCWARVADTLRQQGHRCFTPSYTGMGDRAHLLSKDITMETFVQDIMDVITSEDLTKVVLVGHSFGGIPISGVADRMPERLRHLVYLDSNVLESGQTAFSTYPAKDVEDRIAQAQAANGGLAVPVPAKLTPVWGFAEGSADYDWVKRRLTPHPLRSYQTPVVLKNPIGNNIPRTYIHNMQPENPVLESSRQLVKSLPGWNWIDFPAPHDSMITHPEKLSAFLASV